MDEARVLTELQAQRPACFRTLAGRFRLSLADCEDVWGDVQLTVLRALRRGGFDPARQPQILRQALKCRAIDRLRKRGSLDRALHRLHADRQGTERFRGADELDAADLLQLIERVRLSRRQRLVLSIAIEHAPVGEVRLAALVAQASGRSEHPTTVRQHLHTARRKVREFLARRGYAA